MCLADEARRGVVAGRGLHSTTFQLNLSRFWFLKVQQASTSLLNLKRFLSMKPPDVAHRKCSHQAEKWTHVAHKKCVTLSPKVDEFKPLVAGGHFQPGADEPDEVLDRVQEAGDLSLG